MSQSAEQRSVNQLRDRLRKNQKSSIFSLGSKAMALEEATQKPDLTKN